MGGASSYKHLGRQGILRVDRSVQRIMNAQARKVEAIPRGFGHIRLRGRLDNHPSDWKVECFGRAPKLEELG